MAVHTLAGKKAPRSMLVNIPRLISSYYTRHPDVSDTTQQVAFGTSGHRGSSFKNSFTVAYQAPSSLGWILTPYQNQLMQLLLKCCQLITLM